MFQPLIGTIKTVIYEDSFDYEEEFQPLIGTIKTLKIPSDETEEIISFNPL